MEQTIEHHYTYNNRILPVALELGGKDGFYVRHDVKDVKAAAEALVDGAIYNSG
jgi:acyl-CoA reductase-like NAD-dependent aldehyde dehydrogenase